MAQLGKLFDRLPLPIRPPNLKIRGEINRGAFGVVYEGLFDGQPVAVKGLHKVLQDAAGGENALRTFCQECKRLQDLDHPHVIKYMGTFNDIDLGPVLVMERMTENLREFLERHTGKLDIQDQIRVSLEVTKGITFLHHLNPPMVHRDLNDKNVMFTSEGVAKIGDFGQSKLKEDIYLTSLAPGMLTFMPPEALEDGNSKYDESLDMFSLGVLMLEIGTQQFPAPNVRGIGVISEVKRREKDLGKMETLHPLKPFILRCLNDDRKQRPKSAEMLFVLSTLEVAGIARRDDSIKRLEDMCEHLKAQAAIFKSDFEQERRDREEAAGKVAEERLQWRASIVAQNEQLEAERLKYRETLAQLEHMKEVVKQRNEEHARLPEVETQRLQKELTELKKHEQEIMVDMQKLEDRFREAAEQNRVILSQLNHVQNSQQLAEERARRAESDCLRLQDESTRLRSGYQEAQEQLGEAVKEKETIQSKLDHTKETFDLEMKAKDELIAQMRLQLKSYEDMSSNAVESEDQDAVTQGQIQMDLTTPNESSQVIPEASTIPPSEETTVSVLTEGPSEEPTAAVHKEPEIDSSVEQQQTIKDYTAKDESKQGQDSVDEQHTEVAANRSKPHTVEEAPITQDASLKDAPKCEKCGQVFPFNKKQLVQFWEHKCPEPDESSENMDKPVPASVTREAAAEVPEMPTRTRSSTISGKENPKGTGNEDLPKGGSKFIWDSVQSRWKSTCKPAEVTHTPDRQQRRKGRPVSAYNLSTEALASDKIEDNSKSEADGAPLVCKCGKTFPGNQRREFVMHKLACVKETPPGNGTKGSARTVTLPRKL